ncbi:hypothetical protein EVAR_21853_1 [Eumeta japonica]|uniref:DUF8040 domain-containing protein n=1 Tax=Eumeta variegata TaxID=151549 RepID=A0A4C1V7W6_EUMVA|nr:hypothetical protein EVAR_21853_1 [Eumeta japonica]
MHALHYLWALQSEENVHRRRLRRRNRPRVDINNMLELEFYHTFRLSRDSFESLCARLVQHALLTNSQDVTVRQKVLCALHFFASGSYQRALATGHCVSQQALSEEDFRDEEVAVQDVNEEIDLRGLAVLNNLITTHFQ